MREQVKQAFSEAVKLKEKGDLNSAKQSLMELAKEEPESTAIWAVLGDVCWDMRLLDEAATIFKRAIALSPKLEAVSLGLFHCLWESGKREEALDEANRFMSIADSGAYREIVNEINEKLE